MPRPLLLACLLVSSASALAEDAPLPPLQVNARAVPDKARLGEPFTVEITVTHVKDQRYDLQPVTDMENFDVVDSARKRVDGADSATTTFELKLSAFQLGKLKTLYDSVYTPTIDTQWLPGEPTPKKDEVDWDLWLGPAPWRPYNHAYVEGRWRGQYDFDSGARLLDWGAYTVDLCQWANDADATTPVSFEPSETRITSLPRPPNTVSPPGLAASALASANITSAPGPPWVVSTPMPAKTRSRPRPPRTTSSPLRPRTSSEPWRPSTVSLPSWPKTMSRP